MTMKNIAISGVAGVGKSRLTYLIKEALKEKGFEVTLVKDADFPSEEVFDTMMARNYDEAIEEISRKAKITIVQAQVARTPQENNGNSQ